MPHWPEIPYENWASSGQSLHMWLQIVGKFRLAHTPWLNHSWHATFYLTARGLTTSLVPGVGQAFSVEFDFLEHRLAIQATGGASTGFALEAMSTAEFHTRFLECLDEVGAATDFHGAPNETAEAIAFIEQTAAGTYDEKAVQDFWLALVSISQVFEKFRTGFLGKVSPVHLFWGSLDLAVTRFSGRKAPPHPGGIPNLPDDVSREAYSHEVSSAGFWPGGGGMNEPCFYSYAYPVPDGFGEVPMSIKGASFSKELGEFILPYATVRKADDPEHTLMTFLHETYAAAADLANWNRDALECPMGEPRVPRTLEKPT